MYDRIIVPIRHGDGLDAAAHARPMARALGCELTLLHVHVTQEAPPELEGLTQYRFQHVVETWDERDLEAELEETEWLKELADELAAAEPELRVSSRVVHAPLGESLRQGEEMVLVMARLEGVQREGLDLTLQELVRGGGVPVLLVPASYTGEKLRRILVSLDGSRFSEEVLGPALDLARATGARLSLVEVVTRHNGLVRLLHSGERSAEAAEKSLREVRDRIPPELGAVDVRVVEHGNPAAGIAQEARREDVDLVAMATHGRGGLMRLIMGSVAESVVRTAPVPVLVFRPLGTVSKPQRPQPPRSAAVN